MKPNEFKKMSSGEIIPDLAEYARTYIINAREETGQNIKIIIGTDSQRRRKNKMLAFVTVVCFYMPGKGGHVIYKLTKQKNIKDDSFRLWQEVELSLECAKYLNDSGVFDLFSERISIHIDVNPNKQHKSNQIFSAAKGYVEGLGFIFAGKPASESYVASVIADNLVKNK